MSESDKHEWAAGVHAALFSLAIIAASVCWHNRFALLLILVSQGLAYLGRAALQVSRYLAPLVVWSTIVSVALAVLAALSVLIGGAA